MDNPHIAAGIRQALNALYRMGAGHFADYWLDELHQVNGYPIENRWNAMTLRQIQRDALQIAEETGQSFP
jgi:hypothetical protein